MQKTNGIPTFHVNAQTPISSRNLPTPNQKPTFHTISPNSFREEVSKVKATVTVSHDQDPAPRRQYGDTIRFANPKTTRGFTHRQEKNLVPPKKRLRTSKYPKDPTVVTLSGRKPVNTALPTDAWALVLKSCDLKFLTDARLVCRAFHEILSKESIWREVREASYPLLPACPPGLTEMQYANLLAERGCQIRPCTRGNTRKIYWPFMLRMCEQCYQLNTRPIDNTSSEEFAYDMIYQSLSPDERTALPRYLADLLPCAATDSGRYNGVRSIHQGRWSRDVGKYYVLSTAFQKLTAEFSEMRIRGDFDFVLWATRKWDATCKLTEVATILEGRHDYLGSASPYQFDLRVDKIRFFSLKASELDPPIRKQLLEKMIAYHGAIETNNKASLRAWDVLKPKIDRLDLRQQAERLLMWEDYMRAPYDSLEPYSVWDRLSAHRGARFEQPRRYVKEQEVVINIARQQFRNIIDTVHDEDVLLLFLDTVRRTYEGLEEKPVGLNGDGTEGPYQLTMDDARMVIEDILETTSLGGSVRERTVFGSLKCIACWRPDHYKTFGLEELIRHVRKMHCKHVGIDLHFHRIAAPLDVMPATCITFIDPVPWYHIPWPKSFPAVPKHHRIESGMIWNPDEEFEHLRHPDEIGSVFEDRAVRDHSDIERDDLRANFCQAIKVLAGTRLDAPALVKISLEYASQRAVLDRNISSLVLQTKLSVQEFQRLEGIIQEISPTIKLRFLCGICMKASKSECHARYVRYPTALEKLVTHCEDKHDIDLNSPAEDMLHLPSNSELRQILRDEEAHLKLEQAKIVAKASNGLNRLDPRDRAVLKVPSCLDQFDQLFPLHHTVQPSTM